MKQSSDASHDEPVGIVISRGGALAEPATRIAAYVWGPAPEDDLSEEAQAA
jgi:hypothetical protein